MDIRIDNLKGKEIAKLLEEHRNDALNLSPPESVHALDLDALRAPEITFWSAWKDGELAGCGALKELDSTHGEVKSMRTASSHLRKGVAAEILNRILKEAASRSYTRVSLETGSKDAFTAARNLYKRFGFKYCGPFADYDYDPYSVFMTKKL